MKKFIKSVIPLIIIWIGILLLSVSACAADEILYGAYRPHEVFGYYKIASSASQAPSGGSTPETGEPFSYVICFTDAVTNERAEEIILSMGLLPQNVQIAYSPITRAEYEDTAKKIKTELGRELIKDIYASRNGDRISITVVHSGDEGSVREYIEKSCPSIADITVLTEEDTRGNADEELKFTSSAYLYVLTGPIFLRPDIDKGPNIALYLAVFAAVLIISFCAVSTVRRDRVLSNGQTVSENGMTLKKLIKESAEAPSPSVFESIKEKLNERE